MADGICPIVPTIQCQLNCPYQDCKWLITNEELRLSDEFDSEIAPEPLPDDYRARWRLRNIDRDRENKHRHYMENYEDYKKRREQYYQEHKEELLAKQKEYYQKNKDKISARNRDRKRERWNSNPEYYRKKQREYRLRKKKESEEVAIS